MPFSSWVALMTTHGRGAVGLVRGWFRGGRWRRLGCLCHFFSDAGAASDSRLRVAVFEDGEGDFHGLVMGGDDTLIFLDEGGDADALRGAERCSRWRLGGCLL